MALTEGAGFKGRRLGMGERIEFPLLEAFRISLERVRKRLRRSIILVASMALGVTLLTHLEVTNLVLGSYMEGEGVTIEAYQFWLIMVSLLVCGIGLVNANLIAVSERYREIGTMKCLGALDQHVMKLFLMESAVLGLLGGVLGFFAGTSTAILSGSIQLGVNLLPYAPLHIWAVYLALTTGLSTLISVVSTVYPAWRASRLNPVEALRHDI